LNDGDAVWAVQRASNVYPVDEPHSLRTHGRMCHNVHGGHINLLQDGRRTPGRFTPRRKKNTRTEEEHQDHIRQVVKSSSRQVLQKFREHEVYVNLAKSKFGQQSIEFLGHIFDETGVRIKDEYRQAVAEWPSLEDKADLGSGGPNMKEPSKS